jgi:hypothetical protein
MIKIFFSLKNHFSNILQINRLGLKKYLFKYILGIFSKQFTKFIFTSKIKDFKNIFIKGSYTADWTSGNFNNFLALPKLLETGSDKLNIKILEIGSFEGYSANIFNNIFPNSKIYCVDPFLSYSELPSLKFNKVENNFDINTKNINIRKIKMFSSVFFKKYQFFFDIIYVDGSHKADDVFLDGVNSFKSLKKGGIIFFDDFIGGVINKSSPIFGIKRFQNIYSHSLELCFINEQIGFKKKNNKILHKTLR